LKFILEFLLSLPAAIFHQIATGKNDMEKRGIRTERGGLNREIEVTNQKLQQEQQE